MLNNDLLLGYRCAQKGTLAVHMRIHNPEPLVVCQICGRTFTHKVAFVNHMKTVHSDLRPFPCTQCEKTFKTRQCLRAHSLTHSNIRNYMCTLCGKTFMRSSNLTIHMKIHTGEKKFICTVCSKSFLHKNGLDVHMRTHQKAALRTL